MAKLPDGLYPFIDKQLPLSELVIVEAPPQLEALFKAQAAANKVELVRDRPVELRCRSADYPDTTFLIYWPQGQDRIHMLVPKASAKGRAIASAARKRISQAGAPNAPSPVPFVVSQTIARAPVSGTATASRRRVVQCLLTGDADRP